MADLIKRGAAWLGLVTDNRYDDRGELIHEDVTETVEDSALVEYTASVTPLPSRRKTAPEPADLSRIVTVHPKTFNDAKTIGESFRDGFPVIMNLTEMEDFDAKRLVDFAAGLIFATRGTLERVTNKVFLLSPPNVTVAAEDKERMAEDGFFNQS